MTISNHLHLAGVVVHTFAACNARRWKNTLVLPAFPSIGLATVDVTTISLLKVPGNMVAIAACATRFMADVNVAELCTCTRNETVVT